jgi:hypothetical protein
VTPRSWSIAAALALGFLALHLPYLAPSLEDVDSINFALGIRDFDVAEHQPHPPGYPLFILAAKGAAAVIGSEVRALSGLGVLAGALSAFVLIGLFRALDAGEARQTVAIGGALLVLTAPLMWITAARPLSDAPGLAVALLVQWIILRASTTPQMLIAACAAGIAAGIRSQIVWLTVPLMLWRVMWNPELRRARTSSAMAAAYGSGVLLWAVPLLVLSGGLRAYWDAIAFQGSADLSGVTMLWTTPTPRQLIAVVEHGFLAPWGWWPLAFSVLFFVAVGCVQLIVRKPHVLPTLAAAYGPYLVFHTLFQETVTTRYALPLVVPIALLAAIGVISLAPKYHAWLLGGAAALSLAVGHGTLVALAGADAPAFRMLGDMRAATDSRPAAPVLAVHRRLEFDLRRPLRWVGEQAPVFSARLPAPPRLEWMELIKYWNEGGRAPVWFVADPLRSDLALVHHGAPKASYRWPIRFPALIGGVRPSEMDWYELDPPAWYLGEGWALSPETAGVAAAAGRGPGSGGSHGWIRRTAVPVTLMLGGRLLPGGAVTSRVEVSLDGQVVDQSDVTAGFFLRMVELPGGALAGAGDYAALEVRAAGDRVAIEQFDAQPAGALMFGYAEGWHEHEYDPTTGESWRWTSDRATIRIRAAGKALSMRIRGESEAGEEVGVTVRADDQIVASTRVGRDFMINASIPAGVLTSEESAVTIETDGSFIPAETRWRSQDRRRLGLKILTLEITPAS